jgi:diguanylate cyclase
MKKYLEKFALFFVVWLALMAFTAHVLTRMEIQRLEAGLDDHAQHVAAGIGNKLDANEAVLAGFAAFLLAVDKSDADAVTRYAAAISAAYPHIYMLEVARRVPLAEKAAFEALLKTTWRPDFAIKDYPSLTHQRPRQRPETTETWPILFMYPALPEASGIYGLSLESVDYLFHTLALAKRNARPVVSPVFSMVEGGNAFILLQEVNRPEQAPNEGSANFFGDTMTALLLIRTDSLLNASVAREAAPHVRMSALLKSSAVADSLVFDKPAAPAGWLESLLLPTLQKTFAIGNDTQPMTLKFEQQLRWADLLTLENIAILGLYLTTLLAVPVLMFKRFRSAELASDAHERSAYLATHDILTDLPNRYLFADRFDMASQLWERNASPFALLLIDLDLFKDINDTYGHEIGDQVLKTSAKRMVAALRSCDTVARHGGDEFTVLLETVSSIEDAIKIADKLRAGLAEPIETSAGSLRITCSIGVAVCPNHGHTLDALRAAADQAMYEAKKAGRDAVRTFSHLHAV